MGTPLFRRSNIEWLNREGGKGYSINPFLGCAHACTYCWARDLKGIDPEEWSRPKLKPEFQGIPIAAEVARQAPRANILLSATTDPFQPSYFGYNSITEQILRGLCWLKDSQVWVLTKNHALLHFYHWLESARVGITMTSLEPNPMEPNSDAPSLRAKALSEAKKSGSYTYISIEPWVKDITDPKEIIERTEHFTNFWIIGSHNRRMRPLHPDYYREKMPPLLAWLDEQALQERVFIKRELRELGG